MSDGREDPNEVRDRKTSGIRSTGLPVSPLTGAPLSDTMTPPTRSPFGSAPTRSYPGGASSETRAIYPAPRIDDPNAAEGHSEQVRMLFGKYLVVRKLGEGAMGEVWLVRHRDLGAERALKLINLGRFSDPEMRARARREARAMALFSHPNAVAVHDANADGDLAYIEMEYIRGLSVNKVLEPGVPKSLEWVAQIVDQLCAVLEVAHSHGIVHRDLKPSNMMLLEGQPPGRVHLKILDFGIAKILHADEHGHDDLQTRSGSTIGTPAYMSPEQIDSDAAKVDGRSDLYSVGVILFEMLTGRRPFTSASFKLTYDHLYTPPPSFAEANGTVQLPQEVESLVLRCLDKDPNRRPQTAGELRDEFLRLVAPPPPAVETAPPPRRRRGPEAILAALFALTAGSAVWLAQRPTPFTIQASSRILSLAAGGFEVINVVPEGGRSQAVNIQADKIPAGIQVTKQNDGNQTRVAQFLIKADLNASTGEKTVTFRGTAGAAKQSASVLLKVEPPQVTTPTGYVPADGSRLEEDEGKVRPSAIVRDLGNGVRLEFVLVRRRHSNDPASFYIMRDKVSNRLFARFASLLPAAVMSSRWRSPEEADLDLLSVRISQPIRINLWRSPSGVDLDLPAFNVSAEDACRFADWLGQGGAKLRLPLVDQWDQASGASDPQGRRGSFKEPWKPGDGTIAVDRSRPAAVGTSSHDVNPLGCRDMAGNGFEWTRNSSVVGQLLPFGDGQSFPILNRGQTYRNPRPRTYVEQVGDDGFMIKESNTSDDETGFRFVIDEI